MKVTTDQPQHKGCLAAEEHELQCQRSANVGIQVWWKKLGETQNKSPKLVWLQYKRPMSCQQNFQQPVASRWPSVSKPKYKRPATLRGRNRAQKIVDHGYLDTLSLRVYQISYRVRLLWYANLSLFDSIFTLLVLTHLDGPRKSLTPSLSCHMLQRTLSTSWWEFAFLLGSIWQP